MDKLAQQRMAVQSIDRANVHKIEKDALCCPVCGMKTTLREVQGMVLCTHCCWAIALRRAS